MDEVNVQQRDGCFMDGLARLALSVCQAPKDRISPNLGIKLGADPCQN